MQLTNLSVQDIQTILNALSNMPYNQVANLIMRLNAEAQAQLEEINKVEQPAVN